VRAVQDDVTMVGPPHVISGTDGALGALLDGLAEIGLKPQRTKFEALGTTKEALADKPGWLPTSSDALVEGSCGARAIAIKPVRRAGWGWAASLLQQKRAAWAGCTCAGVRRIDSPSFSDAGTS